MAKADFTIRTTEYRPCRVEGKRALFHRWEDRAEIVQPSPMVGGHPGGALKWTVAIVEYEDGMVAEVLPEDVQFVPGLMDEYSFGK